MNKDDKGMSESEEEPEDEDTGGRGPLSGSSPAEQQMFRDEEGGAEDRKIMKDPGQPTKKEWEEHQRDQKLKKLELTTLTDQNNRPETSLNKFTYFN